MDGYVFATGATTQAVAALEALVPGTVRALLPLEGDHAVYVAVAAANVASLVDRLGTVAAVDGLSGVQTHLATPPTGLPALVAGKATPSWVAVRESMGFALATFEETAPLDFLETAVGDANLVGIALAIGGGETTVILEFTADTLSEVEESLEAVRDAAGGTPVATSTGAADAGTGLTMA